MKSNKLITDTNPIDQPQNSHSRAFNIIMSVAKNAIANEKGFKNLKFYDKKVIYGLAVDADNVVVFLVDDHGPEGSEIGILNRFGNYNKVIADDGLNLQDNNPTKAVWIRNFKRELVIVWVDGSSESKILNLDNVPYALEADKSLSNPADRELMYLSPGFKTPIITLDEIIRQGGSLTSGVYFITSQYEMEDSSVTAAGFMLGPIHITKGSLKDTFESYTGTESGLPTNKSIALKFEGVDTRYKYLKLAVVKKENGVISAHYFDRRLIEGPELSVILSGNEELEEVDILELQVNPTIYDSAKTITYHNDALALANLKANELQNYNYQKYANEIRIDYTVDTVKVDEIEGSFKDEYTILTKRGFFPDEVYAFYVRLYFANGIKSDDFHIPGPEASYRSQVIGNGEQTFNVLDRIEDIKNNPYPFYKTPYNNSLALKDGLVHDLEVDPDIKFYQSRETALNRDENNMGVWYNEDELYPEDATVWGSLAGTPVRHHKFPAMDMFVNANSPMLEGYSKNILEVSSLKDMLVWLEKKSQISNYDDFRRYFAIPLKVVSSEMPSVQAQSFWINDEGDTDRNYRNHLEPMGSEYAPLFFLNQVTSAGTRKIKYDISWIFTNPSKFALRYGNDVELLLKIVRFRKTDSNEYVRTEDYEIETWRNLNGKDNIVYNHTGEMNIPLEANESLGLMLELFHNRNRQEDELVSINTYWYKADLEILTVGEVETPEVPKTGKILGIKVRNIQIPEVIKSQVVGYEIRYAKREIGEMRTIGQSLLFGSAPHPLEHTNVGSHAGNNTSYTRVGGGFQNTMIPHLRDDIIRFHGFDIMQGKPAIQPSFVKVAARFKTFLTDVRRVKDKFWDPTESEDEEQIEELERRATSETPVQASYKADFVRNSIGTMDPCDEYDRLRAIKDFKYLLADTKISFDDEPLDNTWSESCAVFSVEHNNERINPSDPEDAGVAYGWLPGNPNFFHNSSRSDNGGIKNIFQRFWDDGEEEVEAADYFMGGLHVHKTNIYKSFDSQELVSTGKIFPVTEEPFMSTGPLFGGDTFLSLYGIRLTAAIYYKDIRYGSINKNEAVKNVFYFPCYTVLNTNLRSEGVELKDNYYPNVGSTYRGYQDWVQRPADFENDNAVLYNSDFSTVHDLGYGNPFKQQEEFLIDFPYRIVKGVPYNPENKSLTLRKFLSNDYYEMGKNRGEIVNIESYGNELLIHHKYGLFKTASSDTLATNQTEITLGSGNIFRVSPSEITISESGYIGTQDMHSCTISKSGYLCIDGEQGKVFLYNGQPLEMSAVGNRNYFQYDFKLKLVEQFAAQGITIRPDQAFKTLGVGYTSVYDEENDRFIVSKKDMVLRDKVVIETLPPSEPVEENPVIVEEEEDEIVIIDPYVRVTVNVFEAQGTSYVPMAGDTLTYAILGQSDISSLVLDAQGSSPITVIQNTAYEFNIITTENYPMQGYSYGTESEINLYFGALSLIAVDDAYDISKGQTTNHLVLSNDQAALNANLQVVIQTPPLYGTLEVLPNNSVNYTHDDSENLIDSFEYYLIADGYEDSNTAVVSLQDPNRAPVAVDDSSSVIQGEAVIISILNNDYDPDGDQVTITLLTQPSHGTATLLNDNTVEYVHNGNTETVDSFTYKLNDGLVDSNIATVTININERVIDNNTKIIIEFDSSGSMNSTLGPLQDMRDTILKERLLPLYNNDEALYDQNVTVRSFGSATDNLERTFKVLNMNGDTPTGNVIVLVFQDESSGVYYNGTDSDSYQDPFDEDMSAFKGRLDSFEAGYYAGVIFQVEEAGNSGVFKNMITKIKNGTAPFNGIRSLANYPEVNYKFDVQDGSTKEYYLDLIVESLEELGYEL